MTKFTQRLEKLEIHPSIIDTWIEVLEGSFDLPRAETAVVQMYVKGKVCVEEWRLQLLIAQPKFHVADDLVYSLILTGNLSANTLLEVLNFYKNKEV